jgi:hypothetical protein
MEPYAYRDKKVVGVFIFRAPLHQKDRRQDQHRDDGTVKITASDQEVDAARAGSSPSLSERARHDLCGQVVRVAVRRLRELLRGQDGLVHVSVDRSGTGCGRRPVGARGGQKVKIPQQAWTIAKADQADEGRRSRPGEDLTDKSTPTRRTR